MWTGKQWWWESWFSVGWKVWFSFWKRTNIRRFLQLQEHNLRRTWQSRLPPTLDQNALKHTLFMRERAPRSFGLSKLWVSENLGNEEVEPIPTCEILFHRFSQQNMYLIKWFLLVQSVLRIYKGESIKNSFLLIFSICHSKKRPSNCKTNDCVKSTKIPDERVTQEAWILF